MFILRENSGTLEQETRRSILKTLPAGELPLPGKLVMVADNEETRWGVVLESGKSPNGGTHLKLLTASNGIIWLHVSTGDVIFEGEIQ